MIFSPLLILKIKLGIAKDAFNNYLHSLENNTEKSIFVEQCGAQPSEDSVLVAVIALDRSADQTLEKDTAWFDNICVGRGVKVAIFPWLGLYSDFTGVWETTYGEMNIAQNSTNINGVYEKLTVNWKELWL